MTDPCPNCGSEECRASAIGAQSYTAANRGDWSADAMHLVDCLRRQLAQRDEQLETQAGIRAALEDIVASNNAHIVELERRIHELTTWNSGNELPPRGQYVWAEIPGGALLKARHYGDNWGSDYQYPITVYRWIDLPVPPKLNGNKNG